MIVGPCSKPSSRPATRAPTATSTGPSSPAPNASSAGNPPAGPSSNSGTGPRNVPAAGAWRNNAELIAAVASLGWLPEPVLDLSYGDGKFWTDYRPERLVTNDLDPDKQAEHRWDVRSRPVPPEWLAAFGAVVWDGPYRLSGTQGSGRAGFDGRYGLGVEYSHWRDKLAVLEDGTRAAVLCTRPGGVTLVKCQDQVSGGQKRWQTRVLADAGEQHGARLMDMLHLVRKPRSGAVKHASSNYSTLLVFKRLHRRTR